MVSMKSRSAQKGKNVIQGLMQPIRSEHDKGTGGKEGGIVASVVDR